MSPKLRIASFNANSIRSRLEVILDWMLQNECDVLCVQETKATDDDFPIGPIVAAGYHCAFAGQKSYNGVAIISRYELLDVRIGIGNPDFDVETRVIRADVAGVTIVNTYAPQGTAVGTPRFAYKLQWFAAMRDYFEREFTPDAPIVWAGDLNVAREPIDVYDPEGLFGNVCYHPDEHKALDYAMGWGFVDLLRKHHPCKAGLYTFWDYRVPNAFKRRLGWRLDHICATAPLAELCTDCRIDTLPRQLEKPSDHTFIIADFEL
ncbi:MAG: exodeoxyribonuclease III [Armatimonadetes bacterium]|nr:exodeoxyribonuclease III [Armatimonadota bacterium]